MAELVTDCLCCSCVCARARAHVRVLYSVFVFERVLRPPPLLGGVCWAIRAQARVEWNALNSGERHWSPGESAGSDRLGTRWQALGGH